MKKFFFALICTFLLGAAFSQSAFAQDPTPPTDDEVNAIAKHIYCPVCENTPLDVCPTEACRNWREQIRSMLAEGKTEDEIMQYFVDQYGDRVLGAPPATGLNWLVYLIPPLVILLGAIILFRALKGWTQPKQAEAGSGAASGGLSNQDEYIQKFEEELKKRK
ncbi:MAG: cytochrome c-type biogenesis protein CcmH [Anaerolineales bacterium]|nr:cytochrome c-type biogenesis protein CcmH [Anaerolineales bacterium]